MTTIPVTLVTQNATHDDMTDTAYAEIFAELRQQHSLAQLCELLHSKYSRALWNKYERGDMQLTRQMRNELRAAVGLPVLPPTVAEAAAAASPDAAVWQVGTGPAEHVIMVASPEPLTLHVNGAVSAASGTAPCRQNGDVTEVTRTGRKRRQYTRPVATVTQNSRRLALGAGWREIIEAGLSALEREAR